MLSSRRYCQPVSQRPAAAYVTPPVDSGSLCSGPSSMLGMVCLSHFSHSLRDVMVFHRSFIFKPGSFLKSDKIRDVFSWTSALNRELENLGRKGIGDLACCAVGL